MYGSEGFVIPKYPTFGVHRRTDLKEPNQSRGIEVRAVLDALGKKIIESRQELSDQAIDNALYGLQAMSNHETEVRTVLDVLARKIGESG